MALFEGYERRIDQINAVLNSYGISSIEEAEKITKDAGLNVYDQVKKIQPICFENACWAYTIGAEKRGFVRYIFAFNLCFLMRKIQADYTHLQACIIRQAAWHLNFAMKPSRWTEKSF